MKPRVGGASGAPREARATTFDRKNTSAVSGGAGLVDDSGRVSKRQFTRKWRAARAPLEQFERTSGTMVLPVSEQSPANIPHAIDHDHNWGPALAAAAVALALYAITLGGTYVYDDTFIVGLDPRLKEP